MSDNAAQFVGSIPEIYDRHIGPVLFEPYAQDLAARIEAPARAEVLELACGTGILTRQLLARLGPGAHLVATDLNQPMIDHAMQSLPSDPRLEYRAVDAMDLPFGDGAFDRIVCQFGVMFFPDKRIAAREARRVLKRGGTYWFSVWAAIEHNRLIGIGNDTVVRLFPDDPPTFYRTPFGYYDPAIIRADLESAGFRDVTIETVDKIGVSESARHLAEGMVHGNPIKMAIEARGRMTPDQVVEEVAHALTAACGAAPCRAPLRALVVSARA